MAAKSPYSPELRRRAVRMVGEVRPQYQTEWAAITAVAEKLALVIQLLSSDLVVDQEKAPLTCDDLSV